MMKKWFRIGLIIVILAALGAGGWLLYGWLTREAPLAETYQTYTVATGEVRETLSLDGKIVARETVTLYLDASQTVDTVNVQPGDAVRKGDVLVTYNTANAARELSRALEEAQISLRMAELNLQSIAEPEEVSGLPHDTALRYEQQENAIRLAAIAVESIEDALAKLVTQTISPVTGSVLSVNAVRGATLPKNGAIVALADLSSLIVRADISEYDIARIAIGQAVELRIGEQIYTGTITKISAHAVTREKSSGGDIVVPIEISIDNAAGLKPGFSADTDVLLAQKLHVLSIPTQALRNEGGNTVVYLLRDGKAVQTTITVGLRGSKSAEITNGLQAGDIVLVDY